MSWIERDDGMKLDEWLEPSRAGLSPKNINLLDLPSFQLAEKFERN
jgi:hypothetical protein